MTRIERGIGWLRLQSARTRGAVRGRAWRIVQRAGRRKRRSVVFLHNSYYHFYYLSQALRRRGWDALTVSVENPEGPNARYYHGEDVNLFSPDPVRLRCNIEAFYREAIERFALLHFAGDGIMSFFPDNWASDEPWDMLEWRSRGHKIAYTISGCNSGVTQSAVARWSASGGAVVCDRCVWQLRPDICSDAKNLAWGRKVDRFCDLIFTEGTPALDYQAGPKAVREPTTMCLDPNVWHPNLIVPDRFRVERKPDEMLVYHSFGHYDLRSNSGRNIKGTAAVVGAVERLRSDGIPVRLMFVTDRKSTEVRFLQAQADVIVDQLNYGRYGATAREAMMLGKPTICYLNREETTRSDRLRALEKVPLLSATEDTIYAVLRDLLLETDRRAELGRAGRRYALTWHSAETCAARYEQIYDMVMAGRTLEYPYPARVREERTPVRPAVR
jgi:glycosyltransferase involved in cell wall biosynthesis